MSLSLMASTIKTSMPTKQKLESFLGDILKHIVTFRFPDYDDPSVGIISWRCSTENPETRSTNFRPSLGKGVEERRPDLRTRFRNLWSGSGVAETRASVSDRRCEEARKSMTTGIENKVKVGLGQL